MRPIEITAIAVVLIVLLTGCAGDPAAAPARPQPTASRTADRPLAEQALGGFWRVRDAAGEQPDTWLRFAPRELTLFRTKGRIDFAWAAGGDAIVASRSGRSMRLGDDDRAPWLSSAASIARTGDGWVLADVDGRTVARLARDGGPDASMQYETEPTPFRPEEDTLRDAVPCPGVHDLAPAALGGRWVLEGHREASLTFAADGTWSNRPSCASGTGANREGGAYRVLPGGLVLLAVGPAGLVGCGPPTDPIAPDLRAIRDAYRARSLGIEGDRLTLFNVAGAPIGTLVR